MAKTHSPASSIDSTPQPSPTSSTPSLAKSGDSTGTGMAWRTYEFKDAKLTGELLFATLHNVEDGSFCYRITSDIKIVENKATGKDEPQTSIRVLLPPVNTFPENARWPHGKEIGRISWFDDDLPDIWIHHVKERHVNRIFQIPDNAKDKPDFLEFPARFRIGEPKEMAHMWRMDKKRLALYLDKVDAGFSPASLEGKNAYVPPPSLAEMFFDCKYLPKCGAIKKCSLKQGVPFLRLPVLGSKTEDQYLTTEIIISFIVLELFRQTAFDVPEGAFGLGKKGFFKSLRSKKHAKKH